MSKIKKLNIILKFLSKEENEYLLNLLYQISIISEEKDEIEELYYKGRITQLIGRAGRINSKKKYKYYSDTDG